MQVDGEKPSIALVDAKNLLGTWLPKVHAAGQKRLREIIDNGSFYFAIGVDETDDKRPSNDFIVTTELMLIPKVVDQESAKADVQTFHLQLEFPEAVNHDTIASILHEVFAFPFPFVPLPASLRSWPLSTSQNRMFTISSMIPLPTWLVLLPSCGHNMVI